VLAVDLFPDAQTPDAQAANEEMRRLGLASHHELHEQGRRKEWEKFLRAMAADPRLAGGQGGSSSSGSGNVGSGVFAQRFARFGPGTAAPPGEGESPGDGGTGAEPSPERKGDSEGDGGAGGELISSGESGDEDGDRVHGEVEVKDEPGTPSARPEAGAAGSRQSRGDLEDESADEADGEGEGEDEEERSCLKHYALGFLISRTNCIHVVCEGEGKVVDQTGKKHKVKCNKGSLRMGTWVRHMPQIDDPEWSCGPCQESIHGGPGVNYPVLPRLGAGSS
jgi:hypothetical protein